MNNISKYKLGLHTAEYQILIGKDGDKWCALLGPNLQEGISGFGDTEIEALYELFYSLCSKNS